MSEETIFAEAVAITDRTRRQAYLRSACGDDAVLLRGIEELLRAHETHDLLDEPLNTGEGVSIHDVAVAAKAGGALAGSTELLVGRYRLAEPLGEGGMGLVYRAEQVAPVRRPVAVKLIRPGMDSARVLARFEAERQALAVMDHPGIAKVLDAGTLPNGQPFFVMELVPGRPLTRYCDERRLSIADRLQLFIQVCKAVQHAHQKGIIHRDLKPGNVLVTEVDDRPVVKVIDFGLAKALAGGVLPDVTMNGMAPAFGTPLYMAPEQADGSADVDTRADIHALGAILYELLTGSTPINRDTLRTAPYAEMLRVIRDVEPPTPLSRLANDDTLPDRAAQRQIDPQRLKKLVRGDLEWVTMKCLEKDRNRRYDTATALAMDLERHLASEPVTAAPPSRRYKTLKYVRRNRAAVLATAAFVVTLVAGIVATAWSLVEARRAAQAEKDANVLTQKRLEQIVAGNEILTAVFADLDIRKAKRGNVPLEAVLAGRLVAASDKLDSEAIGDPQTLAAMQHRLGTSLYSLGHYRESVAVLRKALAIRLAELGPDHLEVLESQMALAISMQGNGEIREALPLREEVVRKRRDALGPDHPDTLQAMQLLGDSYTELGIFVKADDVLGEVYRVRERSLPPNDPALLSAMSALAKCYSTQGEPRKAVPLLETVLERERATLGAGHLYLMTTLVDLSMAYSGYGDAEKAAPLAEEALAISRKHLGADHPDTIQNLANLAVIKMLRREFDAALPLCRESLALNTAKLGPTHPNTLSALSDLAACLAQLGQYQEALPLMEKAAQLWEEKLGRTHINTLLAFKHLADAHMHGNQLDKAAALFQFVWENRQNQPMFFICGVRLTNCYARLGNTADCVAAGKEVIAALRLQHPPGSRPLAESLEGITYHYLMAKAYTHAQTLQEEVLQIQEQTNRDSAGYFVTLALLARARAGTNDPAAEAILKTAYEGLVKYEKELADNRRTELTKVADALITLYKAANKPEDVAKWEAELAKWKLPEKK